MQLTKATSINRSSSVILRKTTTFIIWRAPKTIIVMIRMTHDAALMVFARSMGFADVLLGRICPFGNFMFKTREKQKTSRKSTQEETTRK